jgi:hypothetical protein
MRGAVPPLNVLVAWCLIKYMDKLPFFYITNMLSFGYHSLLDIQVKIDKNVHDNTVTGAPIRKTGPQHGG